MAIENQGLYSIGHSMHPIQEFLALLGESGIAAIADVRSTPYSRRQPQFNRDALRVCLAEREIAYVFLGLELGGRGADASVRDEDGRVKYGRIAESSAFRQGIRRVVTGGRRMRIALLCAESDPLDCHRGILISRLLVAQGLSVSHIHSDGRIEDHRQAEQRLLHLTGLGEPEIFRTQPERLAEAYARQEARIAYVAPEVSGRDRVAQ